MMMLLCWILRRLGNWATIHSIVMLLLLLLVLLLLLLLRRHDTQSRIRHHGRVVLIARGHHVAIAIGGITACAIERIILWELRVVERHGLSHGLLGSSRSSGWLSVKVAMGWSGWSWSTRVVSLISTLIRTSLDTLLAFFTNWVNACFSQTILDTTLAGTTIVTLFTSLLAVDFKNRSRVSKKKKSNLTTSFTSRDHLLTTSILYLLALGLSTSVKFGLSGLLRRKLRHVHSHWLLMLLHHMRWRGLIVSSSIGIRSVILGW